MSGSSYLFKKKNQSLEYNLMVSFIMQIKVENENINAES
jgi:hypothetical protein